MRKVLSVWLLCCGFASLALAEDEKSQEPICGTPEVITKALKNVFNEEPIMTWIMEKNMMGVMYYNAKTKTATFAQVERKQNESIECVVGAGIVTHMNIDNMKEHEDL